MSEIILSLFVIGFVVAAALIGSHFFGDVGLVIGVFVGVFLPPGAVLLLLKIKS